MGWVGGLNETRYAAHECVSNHLEVGRLGQLVGDVELGWDVVDEYVVFVEGAFEDLVETVGFRDFTLSCVLVGVESRAEPVAEVGCVCVIARAPRERFVDVVRCRVVFLARYQDVRLVGRLRVRVAMCKLTRNT